MNLQLETERLFLRPFIKEDAPFLFELNNDEEVMRYTGDVPFKDVEAAQEFAIDYSANKNSQYRLYQMGRIAVIRKSDDAFLGWSGLKYHKSADFVDIGYRFMKKYWGHGYATESGLEVVRHAFEDHQLELLVAQVHELNYPSQKVAQRLGMHINHRFYWEEREPGRHYQIDKDHYFSIVKK